MVKPGGLVFHAIDLCDHLSYFDPKARGKSYCRFDGPTWDRWLNSKTQYINRIQRPEWLSMFEDGRIRVRGGGAGERSRVVSSTVERSARHRRRVHPSYAYLTRVDLETTTLVVVLRKPLERMD